MIGDITTLLIPIMDQAKGHVFGFASKYIMHFSVYLFWGRGHQKSVVPIKKIK